ncbi:hypothetical protein JRQ81_015582 [Phrynocephalus forsythii]|uniref:G-protein coupled receptors family 1 profile domain-containing protein n=1 Tax=Phrynocephalus forsythii TaxID=171643 RepID=A0A9Q0XU62_9SAUR|nr:hypothetical protein JRQ81_015582 [Phrynocephalus forsythii]
MSPDAAAACYPRGPVKCLMGRFCPARIPSPPPGGVTSREQTLTEEEEKDCWVAKSFLGGWWPGGERVLALAGVHLAAFSLSLLGSGSILAAAILWRRCCCDQLRPLFLLSLSDLLAALALVSTAAAHFLPARLFLLSARFWCPPLLMLGMMFYAISFLMVVVYAYEVNRGIGGWRAMEACSGSSLGTRRACQPKLPPTLPYILAWALPLLVFLGLLVTRGVAPQEGASWSLDPLQPHNHSSASYRLCCSSCLMLIHHSPDICSKDRKDLGKEGKIFFLVFVASVVACCTVLYSRATVCCWKPRARPLPPWQTEGCARRSHATGYFQLVFVVCWMPAFLLAILSFTGLPTAWLFPLYVAVALTVSLQGLLHSLVYGWLRQNFREEVTGEQLPLRCPLDLKAFYDDSLATSSAEG